MFSEPSNKFDVDYCLRKYYLSRMMYFRVGLAAYAYLHKRCKFVRFRMKLDDAHESREFVALECVCVCVCVPATYTVQRSLYEAEGKFQLQTICAEAIAMHQ